MNRDGDTTAGAGGDTVTVNEARPIVLGPGVEERGLLVVDVLPGSLRWLLDSFEFVLLVLCVSGLYFYVPYARVRWRHALTAGLLATLGIELAVFGSGARLRFIPPAWQAPLMAARLGLETMDTPAACRQAGARGRAHAVDGELAA